MPAKGPEASLPIAPRRGEVWWINLDPVIGSEIAKTRPCAIIGRNRVNELRRTVLVVPLSSSPTAHPPIHIAVHLEGKPGVAVIDQVRAVSKLRLRKRIGSLAQAELASIAEALRQVMDLG